MGMTGANGADGGPDGGPDHDPVPAPDMVGMAHVVLETDATPGGALLGRVPFDQQAFMQQCAQLGLRPVRRGPTEFGATFAGLPVSITHGTEAAAILPDRGDGSGGGRDGAGFLALSAALSAAVARAPGVSAPDQGARVLIARRLCALAALLADAAGATGMYWPPADLWSATDRLAPAVIEMEAQSLPPILHLVRFDWADAEAAPDLSTAATLTTAGLAWFCGQELRLVCPRGFAPAEGMRRIARVAVDMLINGPITASQTVKGIVRRERWRIAPPTVGNLVTISPV